MDEYGLLEDNLTILTDEQECKETLGHYYPILLENTKENITGNKNLDKRYYKDFFIYNNKEYYVTNDWYEKTKDKTNKRNNRPIFVEWIHSLLNE